MAWTLRKFFNIMRIGLPLWDVIAYVVVSRDRNHFMLMHEGGRYRRVHGCMVHANPNDKSGFTMMAVRMHHG
jgi:hypothetical protein